MSAPDKSGIYIIENTNNRKAYVGSAVSLESRKKVHFCLLAKGIHHSAKLQNAYNKHGKNFFEFKVLVVCLKSDLLMYEQLIIDYFKAAKIGYNIAPKAGSCLGVRRSLETRRKIGNANTGKKHSEDARARMKLAQTGKTLSVEARAKVGAANKGKKLSAETKAKVSAGVKALWADPEYRAKQLKSQRRGTRNDICSI